MFCEKFEGAPMGLADSGGRRNTTDAGDGIACGVEAGGQ